MVRIAECESGSTQYRANGTLIRDWVTGDHVGIYQISMKHHFKKALSMGWDIRESEGNISYALFLYHLNGTRDWLASERCWQHNE